MMQEPPNSNELSRPGPEVVRGTPPHGWSYAWHLRDPASLSPHADGFGPGFGDPDQGGVVECLRILRRHKFTLLLTALFGSVIGFLLTRSQVPMYQSRASIELQDVSAAFPSISRNSQEAQPYAVLSDLQTQIRILQSRTLASLAVAKLKSLQRETASPNLSIANDPELMAAANSVRVRSAGDTRIIDVLVDSTKPQLAADYANALATEFIDQNTEQRLKRNQRTTEWLRHQLDEMRRKLEGSEHALQSYAQQAGLLFTGGASDRGRTNISEEKLRQGQLALSAAIADRASKQARNQVANSSSPEALPEVLNDPSLREYRTQLLDLRRQVAELSAVYTRDFSKIKRLQAQIQMLETSFERERTAVIQRIRNEYDEAIERERLLLGDYADQAKTVNSESEKAVHYQILAREVDSNRQIYDAMLHRIRESGIDAALKASSIRLLDAATVPEVPYKPNTPMSTALGLLSGLFLGAGAVIVRARSDRSIKAPGETLSWLSVPELGVIPSFSRQARRRGHMLTLQRDSVMIAESFRVVLTSIIFTGRWSGGQKTGPGRVLVCTSASPAEGKTTIATNLAIALSNIGERVLLIDADLSRSSLHEVFNIENDLGLTTLLQSPSISDEMIKSTIRETASGVYVVPAGPQLSEAADLLFARQMPELLSRFKSEFDSVIIDTPPTPQLSHARLLGRVADGVVLVVRAGHTTREAALGAVQRLSEDRINILGTVLNDWNPKKAPSEYYGNLPRRGYGTERRPGHNALMRVVAAAGKFGERDRRN